MADPFRCLRTCSISIGVWSILCGFAEIGILGWQIQVIKEIQWEYENRQLPATGVIDAYQARFPGLYARYSETPDRRRINAMFAVVLICFGLNILFFLSSTFLLYGTIKNLPNWILPWFFISTPNTMLLTAYSILWWSGDVFNENLTYSVSQFIISLAINGICEIVVLIYYLRLTGRISGRRSRENDFRHFAPQNKRAQNRRRPESSKNHHESQHNQNIAFCDRGIRRC